MLSTRYENFIYPKDHWALDNNKEGTCLAYVRYKDKFNYAIKLNPTDRRGYRVLVTFIGDAPSQIQTTFNRSYTTIEQKGLAEATTFIQEIFKKLGLPIVQTAQAGNNSQSLSEDGITIIGNNKEPSMLHIHVFGRGNPKYEYIPGVTLEGPKPGEMFDMMAKTPNVVGNESKKPWDMEKLKIALSAFKDIIHQYITSSEFEKEFSNTLKVNIVMRPEDLKSYSAIEEIKPITIDFKMETAQFLQSLSKYSLDVSNIDLSEKYIIFSDNTKELASVIADEKVFEELLDKNIISTNDKKEILANFRFFAKKFESTNPSNHQQATSSEEINSTISESDKKSVSDMSKEERRALIEKLKNGSINDGNAQLMLQKLTDNPHLNDDVEIFLIEQVLKIQQNLNKDPKATYTGLKFSFSLNSKPYSTEQQPKAEIELVDNSENHQHGVSPAK